MATEGWFPMAFPKQSDGVAVIAAANIQQATFTIRGTAPFVQNKFSKKQREKMKASMATPKSQKKAKTEREPRDYQMDFEGSQHRSKAGWAGIPCAAFRSAMIDACRVAGLVMTRAKMCVFVAPDGFDGDDGTPLVRLLGDSPEMLESLVKNDNGSADIRIRAMWREWTAKVTVEFDADAISVESVVNLLDRAGRQVGIGEGRPFSRDSVGQGWGTFVVETTR
jgi:hypothetical protein